MSLFYHTDISSCNHLSRFFEDPAKLFRSTVYASQRSLVSADSGHPVQSAVTDRMVQRFDDPFLPAQEIGAGEIGGHGVVSNDNITSAETVAQMMFQSMPENMRSILF